MNTNGTSELNEKASHKLKNANPHTAWARTIKFEVWRAIFERLAAEGIRHMFFARVWPSKAHTRGMVSGAHRWYRKTRAIME